MIQTKPLHYDTLSKDEMTDNDFHRNKAVAHSKSHYFCPARCLINQILYDMDLMPSPASVRRINSLRLAQLYGRRKTSR